MISETYIAILVLTLSATLVTALFPLKYNNEKNKKGKLQWGGYVLIAITIVLGILSCFNEFDNQKKAKELADSTAMKFNLLSAALKREKSISISKTSILYNDFGIVYDQSRNIYYITNYLTYKNRMNESIRTPVQIDSIYKPAYVNRPESDNKVIPIPSSPVYVTRKYEPVFQDRLIYRKPNGLYEAWFSAVFINKTGVNLRLYFANSNTASSANSPKLNVSIPNGDEGTMAKVLLGWGATDVAAKAISNPYTFYFISDETHQFGAFEATVTGGNEYRYEITKANIGLSEKGSKLDFMY